jgi:hypothetical protein
MSQLTNTSVAKLSSLQDLKRKHTNALLYHAYRAHFKREPTSQELSYWADFLLKGGDLQSMLKRLPIISGERLGAPAEAPGAVDLCTEAIEAVAKVAPSLRDETKPKTGAHQGVITLVGQTGLFYAGRPAKLYVLVENLSEMTWLSGQSQPVFASYHWLDQTGKVLIYEGIRSRLPQAIEPATRKQVPISVIAPTVAGQYILEVTLVHEGVAWMEDDGLTNLRLDLIVEPSLSESGLKILKELQWAKEVAAEKFQ